MRSKNCLENPANYPRGLGKQSRWREEQSVVHLPWIQRSSQCFLPVTSASPGLAHLRVAAAVTCAASRLNNAWPRQSALYVLHASLHSLPPCIVLRMQSLTCQYRIEARVTVPLVILYCPAP